MLKMFRKKSIEPNKEQPQIDKAAFFLAKHIIAFQTSIATWLSKHEKKLTITQKKWALGLFCISMGVVAGSFLYRGMAGRNNPSPSWLQHQSITLPESVQVPDSINQNLLKEIEKMQKTELNEQDTIQH